MKLNTMLRVALLVCAFGYFAQPTAAQVLGGRPMTNPGMGQPMYQPGANSGTNVAGAASGSMIQQPQQGMDRFLRTNRSERDFVGRNRSDIRNFIGAQQALATGQVRAATDGLRINIGANAKKINQALPAQPAKGRYYPKLQVDDENDALNSQRSEGNQFLSTGVLDERLIQRVRRAGGDHLQLSLEGQTVTVTGTAANGRGADLVLQLLQFEPGIDKVVNQMK